MFEKVMAILQRTSRLRRVAYAVIFLLMVVFAFLALYNVSSFLLAIHSPKTFAQSLVDHYRYSFSPLNLTLYKKTVANPSGQPSTNLMVNLTTVAHGMVDKHYAFIRFDRLLTVNVGLDRDYELKDNLNTGGEGYDVLLKASCYGNGKHLIPVFVNREGKPYYYVNGEWKPLPRNTHLAQLIGEHLDEVRNTVGCGVLQGTLSSKKILFSTTYALIAPIAHCKDGDYVLFGLKGEGTIPIVNINFRSLIPTFKYVIISKVANGKVVKRISYPVQNTSYSAVFSTPSAQPPMSMALRVNSSSFVHSADEASTACFDTIANSSPPHYFIENMLVFLDLPPKANIFCFVLLCFLVVLIPPLLFLIAYVFSMSTPSKQVPETLSYVPNKDRKPWEVNAFFKIGNNGTCDQDGVVSVLLSLLFRHKIELVKKATKDPNNPDVYVVIKDTKGLSSEENLVLDIVRTLPHNKSVGGYKLGSEKPSLLQVQVVTPSSRARRINGYRAMRRFMNCVFGRSKLVSDVWAGLMQKFLLFFSMLYLALFAAIVLRLFNIMWIVFLLAGGVAWLITTLSSLADMSNKSAADVVGAAIFSVLFFVLYLSTVLLYHSHLFVSSGEVWFLLGYLASYAIFSAMALQDGLFEKWYSTAFTEYLEWQAFANFLSSEADIGKYQEADLQMWKDWLVYAAALGVADKVFEKFKKILGAEMAQDLDNASLMYHTVVAANVFSTLATPPSTGQSSGGGFGGGFDVGGDSGGFGGGAI